MTRKRESEFQWSLILSSIQRPPVHRIVILQLALTVIVGMIGWLHSEIAAYSAALGGLACALPNAYFIWRAFRYQGAQSMHLVANALYQGVAWKFILTALMFAVIFKMGWQLNHLALFAGFVTVQLGQMFSGKIANL